MKPYLITLVVPALFCLNCGNSEGEKNFEELKAIRNGMSMKEVHSLMSNEPLQHQVLDSLIIEDYESPAAASDFYKVVYAKTDSTVVKVYWGD